jgi:hypothetical protein
VPDFYDWQRKFDAEHPGTHEVAHPFTKSNRQRRRRFGVGVRGWKTSLLGARRRGK